MIDERDELGRPERLHPLFLLTGLGGSLRGMAGGYAFIAYLAVSGRLTYALFAGLALLAFVAIGLAVYWHRFSFRIGANEIRIDSGILNRTHRSIPFDRVQDVEISQGPVARLLGLARVNFETGGSAGKDADEGSLQAIALERAEEIRRLVRSRRAATTHAATDGHEEAEESGAAPVFAMDTRRVVLAGAFNFSLALFAGLFGLSQTFGDVLGFDPLNRSFWASLLSADHPIAVFLLAHQIAAILAGLVLLVLIGLATGITRSVLRDHGFRLDRTGIGLRRRRGLLSKTDVTIAAKRAQAAILASGPVKEHFGWSELRLQSLARDEGGKGDHVLAPLASKPEIADILGTLGWRSPDSSVPWQRLSSAYVGIVAVALIPLYLLIALQVAALGLIAKVGSAVGEILAVRDSFIAGIVFATAFAALILAVRWLAWRRSFYALDDDRLLIRTGWWRRRLLILPVRRIQSIDLTESFISRWFGTAALTFGVAGGSGFAAHRIPALEAKKARDLRGLLVDRLL